MGRWAVVASDDTLLIKPELLSNSRRGGGMNAWNTAHLSVLFRSTRAMETSDESLVFTISVADDQSWKGSSPP